MKQKKDLSWFKFLLVFCILLFFWIKSCHKDKYIESNGITKIVTVSYYDRVRCGKGMSCTYSFGYYQSEYGKYYKAYTDTLAPLGSKFEIKYNPKKPEQWRRTKRIIENQ